MTDLKPFEPLLPKQGKWSVGDNRFDTDGKYPKQLMVFIPEESLDAFFAYLQSQRGNLKPGKCYNYKTETNDEVQGVYFNFKGKVGSDGAFGNINPPVPDAPVAAAPAEDLPF